MMRYCPGCEVWGEEHECWSCGGPVIEPRDERWVGPYAINSYHGQPGRPEPGVHAVDLLTGAPIYG